MDSWTEFWRYQATRFKFRGIVVREAVIAATFWVVLLAAIGQAAQRGNHLIGWSLLLLWAAFAWPVVLVQLAAFADLMNYLLSGRTFLFTRFESVRKRHPETSEEMLARLRATNPRLYWYMKGVLLTARTSPLGGLALWAALVLHRMPDSVHKPRERTAVLKVRREFADAEVYLVQRVAGGRAVASW